MKAFLKDVFFFWYYKPYQNLAGEKKEIFVTLWCGGVGGNLLAEQRKIALEIEF